MALRPIFIAAAALGSLALAACNVTGANNTASNAPADNSAAPVVTNAASADNSLANETNTTSNAVRHPMVGGGDNQH